MVVRSLLIAVSGVLLLASAAVAQPFVAWEAPEGCPGASEHAAEIARLLGRTLQASEVSLRAAVKVTRIADGSFEARIWLGDRKRAARVLRDSRCHVLAHASAVVIALAVREALSAPRPPAVTLPRARVSASPPVQSVPALDSALSAMASDVPAAPPQAAQPEPPAPDPTPLDDEPRAEPEAGAMSSGPSPAAPQPSASPVDAAPEILSYAAPTTSHAGAAPGFFLALDASLGAGTLPNFSPGLAGELGLQGRLWRAGLRVSRMFAQSATLSEPAAVGGSVALTAVALEGGLRARLPFPELRLTGGVEVGLFEAHSLGAVSYGEQTAVWSAGYLGAGAAFPWGSILAFAVRLDALVALTRPQFALVDRATGEQPGFHRPARFGGRIAFALEAHFD